MSTLLTTATTAFTKGNHFIFLAHPAQVRRPPLPFLLPPSPADPPPSLFLIPQGHLRPMTSLILNLLTLHPRLHITYLLHSSVWPALANLITAARVTPDVTDRLKVISALRQSMGFGRECWIQMGQDGAVEGKDKEGKE